MAQAGAVHAWPAVAQKAFGPNEATRLRAIRVDGDTLVVAAATPAHAAEVRLRERELLAAIAAAAPDSGIAHVRCAPSAAGDR